MWKSKILYAVFLIVFAGTGFTGQTDEIVSYLEQNSIAIETADDLDELIEAAGARRIVLLGEASHGTKEYYTWRAEITKRLIEEKGFDFILLEGDWPSCYEVNRYIKGLDGAAENTKAALSNFQRWPQWMWANEEIAELVQWLAEYNADREPEKRVGFFGKDVYGLADSIDAVIEYGESVDEQFGDKVKEVYACLARFKDDPQSYARFTATGQNCVEGVERVVSLLRENAGRLKEICEKQYFNAKQNAMAVKYGERHYRAMANPAGNSWNERVLHMQHTLRRLLERQGPESKAIVWAHNTHIGDARATSMAQTGSLNIGWLARQSFGAGNVFAVGFGTHRGKVMAGRQWGSAMQEMTVPNAIAGSFGDIFNRLEKDQLFIIFDDQAGEILSEPRGQRAIGVTYDPANERGNYVPTVLAQRYDAFIFIAETTALTPLDN